MNVLTFDIEDWFHILDNKKTKTPKQWNNFPSRINFGTEKIFEILNSTNSKATFFVVGWIAKKHPNIVKKIIDSGFEIGSHSNLHQLVYDQNRKVFYNDIDYSIKLLQDISGQKIKYFRAPGFSITDKSKWAFEILHNLGIEVDCSVFPASRAHGGMPKYGNANPSIISINGIELKELPINSIEILNKPIIFSGGGYFRLFPYFLIKMFTQKSNYVMSYFHPRDFDFDQPIAPGLSLARLFKSYVGIKNCDKKLINWLNDFEFIDVKDAVGQINWDEVKKVEL